jgi:hypothetical protein
MMQLKQKGINPRDYVVEKIFEKGCIEKGGLQTAYIKTAKELHCFNN